jgi:hypothetical protein
MTKDGDMCREWENTTDNQTQYGVMLKARDNYCTNIYTDEPVCFPKARQLNMTSCDVPICGRSFYVNI